MNARSVPVCAERLRRGDLVLSYTPKFGKENLITHFQEREGYCPDASNVGHVAAYVGNGDVIHAVRDGGVQRQTMLSYFNGQKVTLLTWDRRGPDPEMTDRQLVAEFELACGQKYDTAALAQRVIQDLRSRRIPEKQTPRKDFLVCSTLIFQVFDAVLGKNNPLAVSDCPPRGSFRMPAAYFILPTLEDIDIAA
ncbi:MAG: hypothetical protein R3D60_11995 [Paracoccaceae bacterium]